MRTVVRTMCDQGYEYGQSARSEAQVLGYCLEVLNGSGPSTYNYAEGAKIAVATLLGYTGEWT